MLILDVKLGNSVRIDGVGTIYVEEKSGRVVRLGFEMEAGPIEIIKAKPPVKIKRD